MAINLQEMVEKLNNLQSLWPDVKKFFNILSNLMGEDKKENGYNNQLTNIDAILGEHKETEGMSQKVMQIMESTNRPLTPKEIKKLVISFEKKPINDKLYFKKRIQTTLAYLKSDRKKLLNYKNGNYSINK